MNNKANTVWYGMEKALVNLGLLGEHLSIDPDALNKYVVRYCPDLIDWEVNYNQLVLRKEFLHILAKLGLPKNTPRRFFNV